MYIGHASRNHAEHNTSALPKVPLPSCAQFTDAERLQLVNGTWRLRLNASRR
jgi:hypothetical protein